MANNLDQIVEKLRKALDASLVSVVLYGSAATGDHHEKFSDYNILCVLTKITPVELRAVEPVFRWWREQGNPSPLLLTEHELKTSTDCFAIEFEDIRGHHRILYGPNLVESLEIDRSFYRAQVECELRTKLLRLRQKGGGVLSDKDALRGLLTDSVSTFCVLFRHALLLSGVAAPVKKREIAEAAARHFGIDAAPFLMLLDQREQKVKAKEIEPEPLFARYIIQIEKVIDAVDVIAK
jgi:predicted nucleotidyltransferase